MAVVSHAVSPVNCPQYRDGGGGATTSSGGNMAAAASSERIEGSGSVSRVIEEKIYVAVGKDFKKNKSLVIWALHNSGGKSICILHVHQPAQMIPLALMGTKFHASSLKEEEVRAYREIERKEMHEMLEDYLVLCRQMGVRSEKLCTEMGSIEKGILELISQHGIRKLVMGAASDKRYSKNMTEIKSKKSTCVRLQAPASCHIWFICKQYLIYTKEATLVESDTEEFRPFSQPASPNVETGQSNHLRSQSITLGQSNQPRLTNPVQDLFRRAHSIMLEGHQHHRAGQMQKVLYLYHLTNWIHCQGVLLRVQFFQHVGSIEDPLYDQLEQAMVEADSSRREAFDAAFRRAKAERDAIDAIRRAKASETLYADESRQRKEIEEALAKEKEELEKKQKERDKIMEEHHTAMEQKNRLESQIADADQMAKELEQKIISAVQLLQNYKKERDELQMERDNALKEAEELRKSRAEASSSQMPRFFSEFSFSEIEEATSNFNQSLKIGEGGYGSIYKGLLRHTQVAIKALHSNSLQGPAEFQQEVDVLSKMRHPNLVTLIGACPEAWTLIYEYLPNGSLEDRLSCRDNSPPLSWQTRIRIATELCSVLIFLHSSKPHSIVHGDLKPANVLLDSKFVSKLSDFGICRLLSQNEGSSNNTTLCCITDPKGTFAYMDPEFLASGELTPKSDVYSFGIILLRLLTGRPALGITKEVQYALDKGNLTNLLDPLAGDWPFVQAEQLARLALRCCEMNRKSRPDLVSDVWRVLEPMKASCGGSSCFRLGAEEHCQPPPYFICPIFQEVMQDPHVAADGFTYEAEALRGWLDSGHENSPMTNVKLTHNHLVPNHALRSAIQEWLQEK
ncbi:U-box domain-containing protein 33-like isoform X2 [Mercurialis annua]|uniref:U-box domain-containing protein 33-like isoform X2 n=1 Tax=Mercurialis annua TaxID=3986 RepID=UPI00215E7DF0|nr:U-box domain-containing protein 33-like isoform X2 [Mercurialis annua]